MSGRDQAGFFEHGRDRLVMPGIAMRDDAGPSTLTSVEAHDDGKGQDKSGGGGGGDHSDLHPFIQGLLKTLPNPEKDKDWPLAQRVKWLQTAAKHLRPDLRGRRWH